MNHLLPTVQYSEVIPDQLYISIDYTGLRKKSPRLMTDESKSFFCGDFENDFGFSPSTLVFEIIYFKSRKIAYFAIFEGLYLYVHMVLSFKTLCLIIHIFSEVPDMQLICNISF